MPDDYGLFLDFDDFDKLLRNDDLADEPVDLNTFVNDQGYLNLGVDLSPIQSALIENMSQIYKYPTLVQLYGEEKATKMWSQRSNEIIAMLGKGSGKDFSSRIAILYSVYKLHCLNDINKYYNKSRGGFIDFLNVAINAPQAQNVFFEPLKSMVMESPYFRDIVEPRAAELRFHERPVRCFSGHSESEAWEGFDFMTIVLDEIAAFKTDAELKDGGRGRHSASQLYNMSKNSVISRFSDVGKIVLLSFPRFKGDFIEQRYYSTVDHKFPCSELCTSEAGVESYVVDPEFENVKAHYIHHVYAIKAASWEANPTKTKEMYASAYATNPVEAKMRYECEPPLAEDAFFKDQEVVRECFQINEEPVNGDGTFKSWFNGKDGKQRYIMVDLATKKDRAALCMVHNDGFRMMETMDGMQNLPVVKMDLIKYWEASVNSDIDFTNIRSFILDLKKRFNIAEVRMDRWQSHEFRQILIQNGLKCEFMVASKQHYDTLSTILHDKRLHGYWSDILVEDELLRLRLMNNNKVDHVSGGYKDGSDALAGAVAMCIEAGDADLTINLNIIDTGDESNDDGEVKYISPTISPEPVKENSSPDKLPDDLGDWLSSIGVV